jgi:hypothetical protein
MWASGRILSLLALLFFSRFSFPNGHACVQSANLAPQNSEQAAASPQTARAASRDDGVKELAAKIASAVKPSRSISLEVKNISSLGVPDAEAIRKALEGELQSQGLRIGSADADVEVTLSENAEGYVWVAQTRRNTKQETSPRVAIVSIAKAKANSVSDKSASLVLSKRLIWGQPTQFLDFLVFEEPTTISFSTLLVLEPDRLVYYRSKTPQWETWQTIPFPHLGPWKRTFQGRIEAPFQKVWGPGGQCSGTLADPATMKCSPNITQITGVHIGGKIPDREIYQYGLVYEKCGEKEVVLASGNGDWTQPDSLQGYLYYDVDRPNAVPSGDPIEFDGPIVSMHGDDRESLRAIVHNLKTGNYEGYVVTVACSY